jgi:hypothetical protein
VALQHKNSSGENAESGDADPNPGRPSAKAKQPPGRTREHSAPQLLPHIALPKGGGAIRSIGEKFAVNPATGSGGLSIPLPLSHGRAGFTPELTLAYDSAAGNGVFGFGWTASTAAVLRKTDRGLPRYRDSDESDVFVMSGAEDLVPVSGEDGLIRRARRTVHGTVYEVTRYLPRVVSSFARIERWLDLGSGISHWRVTDRSNISSLFGFDADSRIAAPDDATRVFAYRICRSWDDKGNVIVYGYRRDDESGMNLSRLSSSQRSTSVRATQTYLKSIQYGNFVPWFPSWDAGDVEQALPVDWAFELVLDYGDHQDAVPKPIPDRIWPGREDAFSTYRPGFEVRIQRLCRRFLMFHRFAELGAEPTLVKSLDLSYKEGAAATFLESLTTKGYLRNTNDGSYACPADAYGNATSPLSLPPIEFSYSQAQVDETVHCVDPENLAGAPAGVDGKLFQWVDLDGEGLPGILSEHGNGWYTTAM